MTFRLATLMLGFAALVAAPAHAEMTQAVAAFEVGDYDTALNVAIAEDTADTRALAARILLAQAMSGSGPIDTDTLVAALVHAETALIHDSGHIEGRLQKAIALSLMARDMTTREARKSGYGETAHDLVESVLRDDPDNVYAHGFMSVWNIEVIRRGGRIGAMIMGASLKDARAHYTAAATAAPDDASVHWQYARALAVLDAKKHEGEIKAVLNAALASNIDTALERTMQERASLLLRAFESEKTKQAARMAEELL